MKLLLRLGVALGWLLLGKASSSSDEQGPLSELVAMYLSGPVLTSEAAGWVYWTAEGVNDEIVGRLNEPNWRNVSLQADQLETMRSIMGYLNDGHLNDMNEDACSIFLEFLDLFAVKPMANKACRCTLYRNISSGGITPRMLRLIPEIPASWAQEDAIELAQALASVDMMTLELLDYETLKVLFKSEEACKFMNVSVLLSLPIQRLSSINAACLARMPGLDKVALTPSSPCQITKFAGMITVNDLESLADSQILALGVSQWTKLGNGLINLSDRCLKFVTGDIAHAMKSRLRPDMTSKLASDAFRLFSAGDFRWLKLENLRTDQLASFSAHVPLINSPFTNFGPQDFRNLDPLKFHALDQEHVYWSLRKANRLALLRRLMSNMATMNSTKTVSSAQAVLASCQSVADVCDDFENVAVYVIDAYEQALTLYLSSGPHEPIPAHPMMYLSFAPIATVCETLLRPPSSSSFVHDPWNWPEEVCVVH
ncbi:hypothetical protein PSACC_03159 [Paramicrosporidium saccamoebae]|uniref:Uncharacterized protein n=1 Tax=Paramicrosporidium saccamoebae TaxID=1246581 RepID=A0A2H9TGZ1_9FUNG|nr:hypothetical protein PSACC_03159 [Paramicrosporidium saccamoebae]